MQLQCWSLQSYQPARELSECERLIACALCRKQSAWHPDNLASTISSELNMPRIAMVQKQWFEPKWLQDGLLLFTNVPRSTEFVN